MTQHGMTQHGMTENGMTEHGMTKNDMTEHAKAEPGLAERGTTMTLAQACALVPGSRVVGDADTAFARVHSDTRTLRPGDLFVALRGERFDGHAFLPAARAAGAVAALAEAGLPGGDGAQALPGLLVDDALAALQQLAAAWRARLHLPLVAVAGSNGKTTVTQMAAQILHAWHGDGALATRGNLNNHIGLPLTLLRLRQDDEVWHRAAVVEIGMNHAGETARLARLAAPTVVVVTNAQREHQEFLDGVGAVAREHGAAIEALGAGGTAVLPAADAHGALWRTLAGARRVLTFGAVDDGGGADGGVDAGASPVAADKASIGDAAGHAAPCTADHAATTAPDIAGRAVWHAAAGYWALSLRTPFGAADARVTAPGRHNVDNALAAAAAALAAGAPLAAVARGLSAFRPVAGRSQRLPWPRAGRDATLVDDSYNANPDSVLAAVELLASLPAPRWLVLGDMGEVGAQGPAFHAEVGARARDAGIESLWSAGTLCRHLGWGRHFDDVESLLAALADAPAARSALIKGSRFMRMERIVQALQPGAPVAA